MDREKGAEWLRVLLQKFGPIIKAKCHQIVNYKGGIMFEGNFRVFKAFYVDLSNTLFFDKSLLVNYR